MIQQVIFNSRKNRIISSIGILYVNELKIIEPLMNLDGI